MGGVSVAVFLPTPRALAASSSYSSSSIYSYSSSWGERWERVGELESEPDWRRRFPQILQNSASIRTTLSHCGQVVSCCVVDVNCISATIPFQQIRYCSSDD